MQDEYNERYLLKQLAIGDELAYAQLYDYYRSAVFAIAIRMLKNHAEAEEIVQEVFLRIWTKRAVLLEVNQFQAYLNTITKNLVLDRFKRMANERNYMLSIAASETSESTADFKVRTHQAYELLRNIIKDLPPRQQEVYLLSRQEGLSMDIIAQQLSISKSTAKGHLTAALKQIRASLGENPDDFTIDSTLFLLFAVMQTHQ